VGVPEQFDLRLVRRKTACAGAGLVFRSNHRQCGSLGRWPPHRDLAHPETSASATTHPEQALFLPRLGRYTSALLPATPGPFTTQSAPAGQFRPSLFDLFENGPARSPFNCSRFAIPVRQRCQCRCREWRLDTRRWRECRGPSCFDERARASLVADPR